MEKKAIQHLYRQYKTGQLSAVEQEQWYTVLADPLQDHVLKEVAGEDWDGQNLQELKSLPKLRTHQIVQEILLYPQYKAKMPRYWIRSLAASCVAALLVIGFLILRPSHQPYVQPGGNKAFLTLPDGQTIELRQDETGIKMGQENILYSDGTTLFKNNSKTLDIQTLNLITPRGGQYQITLEDGTQVWLNAGSTLKYPRYFSGAERRVELSGEAYFEVNHRADQPFIIKSKDQEVKVLGTHFMISAYPNEATIKTTLAEGSVEVQSHQKRMILEPDQQSVLKNGVLEKNLVVASEELAWVHGEFYFNDESLESILRKLARWYEIDYDFEEESLKSVVIFGAVSRFDELSKVLSKLEAISDLQLELKGKTIYVRKK